MGTRSMNDWKKLKDDCFQWRLAPHGFSSFLSSNMDSLVVPASIDLDLAVIDPSNLQIGKYYLVMEALREGAVYHSAVMLVSIEDEWLGPNGQREGVFYKRHHMLTSDHEWAAVDDEPRRYAPLSILQGPQTPVDEVPQGESWHTMRFCVF